MKALSQNLIGGALPLAALAVGVGALFVPGASWAAFVALALAGFWLGGSSIIVLHEIAHALAVVATGGVLRAIAFGIEPRRLIGPILVGPHALASARVEFDYGPKDSPPRRFIVYGAGAAAELLLLAINIAVIAASHGRPSAVLALALGALVAGIVSLRLTLTPRRLANGLYTDGFRMLEALQAQSQAQNQASQRWNCRSMLASVITRLARP